MKRNPAYQSSPWTSWADEKQATQIDAEIPAEQKAKKPLEWSDKTIGDYREMLNSFQGVRFAPASLDKRFIRTMRGLDNTAKLTVKQAGYIEKCFHKYRGQIGPNLHKKLCKICGGKKDVQI